MSAHTLIIISASEGTGDVSIKILWCMITLSILYIKTRLDKNNNIIINIKGYLQRTYDVV